MYNIRYDYLIVGSGLYGAVFAYKAKLSGKRMFGDEVYACPKTVISREYSTEYKEGMEPSYTVNDERNNALADQYRDLAKKEDHVIFGGRLAEYKYYDMAPIVEKVLNVTIE